MRIAIIGSGGAGMTAAWLLDGRHQVTLFERSETLGGHARTTVVERDGHTHYADEGFGWFSDLLYPCFLRLLARNGVALRDVPLSASFTQRRLGRTMVLPPSVPFGVMKLLARPSRLAELLRLDRAFRLGEAVVAERQTHLTWNDFITRHALSPDFCRDILTPMVIGGWGAPAERAGELSAYPLLKYFVLHRPRGLSRYPWKVVRDGAASYIRVVASGLSTCTLRPGARITGLTEREQGWTLHDQEGSQGDFDHVIVATGARDAATLLRQTPGLDSVRAVLDAFEYYTVRVATHSDPSLMPPARADWQVANIATDGVRPALTVWTGAQHGSSVFTSYIGEDEPRELHNVSTFHLPLILPAHYTAQARLASIQGQRRLHFAGDWTRDIGCHEDAVVSAIEACRRIDDQLPRLAELDPPALPAQ